METKTGPPVEVKVTDESKGEVEAVFSTLNVIDKDKDVTLPGAFGDQTVRISAYNHASWSGELPVGKGTIRETGDEAILTGKFFMDTTKGRDTFHVIKNLGELMEWSYGYDILKRSEGKWPKGDEKGQDVQFLESVKVHEVSPVILGAGENTRTLSAKSDKGAIQYQETGTTDVNWDAGMMRRRVTASASPLRAMHAWVDSSGNPDSKGSYKFPHHMVAENGAVGAANVRACTAGIAVLNGGRGGSTIPDSDRQGVYAHLSHHIRDAGGTPPPLKQFNPNEQYEKLSMSLFDHIAWAGSVFDEVVTRIAEAVAMRTEKGERLADPTQDMVNMLLSSSERLREAVAIQPESQNPNERLMLEQMFRHAQASLFTSGRNES
jgi:HK97 family phage prohead protease